MRLRGVHSTAMVLALLAMLLLSVGAMAGDKKPCKPTCDSKKSCDKTHAETISIELEDDELILTTECGGDSKIVMVNMDAIGEVVEDALGDVSSLLEDLDDMQVKIHLGEDNMLSFADADTEWELDLGQIAMQVESALSAGFEELDSDEWTISHARHLDDDDMEDLQRELKSLRREMKRLEKILEKNSPEDDD